MNNNCIKKFRGGMAPRMILGSLAALALLAVSAVYAQEKAHDDKEQINFSLIPNPVTPTAIKPVHPLPVRIRIARSR